MNRLTQHSQSTMFTDSDVIVEGCRLGPAAFETLGYYRHYVKIINRLAELEDRFCNEPQTNGDRIRAMTDEELAMLLQPTCPSRVCRDEPPHDCYKCWLDWLKQEVDNG